MLECQQRALEGIAVAWHNTTTMLESPVCWVISWLGLCALASSNLTSCVAECDAVSSTGSACFLIQLTLQLKYLRGMPAVSVAQQYCPSLLRLYLHAVDSLMVVGLHPHACCH